MTRKLISETLAIASVAGTALSLTLAPIAHADPNLQPIIGTVQGDRGNTPCGQFAYNGGLEAAAQAYARSENPGDVQQFGNYRGTRLGFLGSGDPQAAAINSAYTRGAGGAISNCDFKDFGVGFIRHDDRSVDVVTIVFGIPAPPQDAPAPATHHCPTGGDFPANIPCPADAKPLPSTPGGGTVNANVELYDVPGGSGKVIGQLDNGDKVTFDGPCPMSNPNNSDDPTNGWCKVTDTTKNLTGAVWGEFISK